MKRLLLALIGLSIAVGASASPLSVFNAVRLKGCAGAAGLSAVTANSKLDAAASLIAGGAAIGNALSASGYRALHASVIHMLAPAGEADIRELLTSRYCASITDPAVRELGVERRGDEWWLLLAVPAPAAPADARAAAEEILAIVNAARAQGRRCGSKEFKAAPAVTLEAKLAEAALVHAKDMAAKDYFEHQGSDGSSPSERLARTGYLSRVGAGENIAMGSMTPRQVAEGWLASPHHCENIMDPGFTVMGVAWAVNLKSNGVMYWSQEFATPARLPPHDPKILGEQVLGALNAARSTGRHCGNKAFPAVPPLSLDRDLNAAALAHAKDMAAHDFVDDKGSDGSSPQQRLQRAGFKVVSGGEFVASGAMSALEVTEGWLAIPENCETLMNAHMSIMGVAAAENLKSKSLVFWTHIIATPRMK